jgi:aconitate hydratase
MLKKNWVRKIKIRNKDHYLADILRLEKDGVADIRRLPFSIRILVENLLRKMDGRIVTEKDLLHIARWKKRYASPQEIPFHPARVLMQDFTGVPAVVDLAAMRDAVKELGGDPRKINPLVPVDLMVDHSMQVDSWGTRTPSPKTWPGSMNATASATPCSSGPRPVSIISRWCRRTLGICHQVNLENIGRVIAEESRRQPGLSRHLVGTDSHTTMINGIGVMGWGVGGIEAEAVMLGQPYYMSIPEVIGVHSDRPRCGRGHGHRSGAHHHRDAPRPRGGGKVRRVFRPRPEGAEVPDRATIANMTPEYGATIGFFPVDEKTLIDYLHLTNALRPP